MNQSYTSPSNQRVGPHEHHKRQDSKQEYQWHSDDEEEQTEHNQLLQDFREKHFNNNEVVKKSYSVEELRRQPIFHSRQKSFFEKLCKCCVENKDLNKREIKYFYKFRDELVMHYDEKNPDHEATLRSLYIQVFNKKEEDVPVDLKSEEWSNIGFQGKNPRTDFRGAGILGLQCLKYFVQVYPDEFAQMRRDVNTSDFFIAISSFNITHMLMVFLYMNKEEVQQQMKKTRASRKQFKKFAVLNQKSKLTFFELNSFMLIFVYKQWLKELKICRQSATRSRLPPNFQDIIQTSKKLCLCEILQDRDRVIQDNVTLRVFGNALIDRNFGVYSEGH
eukprot:403334575